MQCSALQQLASFTADGRRRRPPARAFLIGLGAHRLKLPDLLKLMLPLYRPACAQATWNSWVCPTRYGQQVARVDLRIPGVTIEWDKGASAPPTPENEIGKPAAHGDARPEGETRGSPFSARHRPAP
jgi:hypothetical protein